MSEDSMWWCKHLLHIPCEWLNSKNVIRDLNAHIFITEDWSNKTKRILEHRRSKVKTIENGSMEKIKACSAVCRFKKPSQVVDWCSYLKRALWYFDNMFILWPSAKSMWECKNIYYYKYLKHAPRNSYDQTRQQRLCHPSESCSKHCTVGRCLGRELLLLLRLRTTTNK